MRSRPGGAAGEPWLLLAKVTKGAGFSFLKSPERGSLGCFSFYEKHKRDVFCGLLAFSKRTQKDDFLLLFASAKSNQKQTEGGGPLDSRGAVQNSER